MEFRYLDFIAILQTIYLKNTQYRFNRSYKEGKVFFIIS